MLNKYSRVKREKAGPCNICLKKSQLTWDHIPPKGGIELKTIEQETVFHRLLAGETDRVFTIEQNGVKFRTLCGSCNNNWLGRKYDPALNDFALTVGRLLHGTIHLPPVIHVRARPTAIMKSILGHLLAAKNDIDGTVFDNEIRDFFFNEDLSIPESIKIFYWVYPYSSIVILRDVAMPAVRGRFDKIEAGFFNIIKYFPIAYLVTNLPAYEGLAELTLFRHLKSDEYAEIPIPIHKTEHPLWPEMVDEGNFVVGSQSSQNSVYATPRKKKI
jgi:hypothetical protein